MAYLVVGNAGLCRQPKYMLDVGSTRFLSDSRRLSTYASWSTGLVSGRCRAACSGIGSQGFASPAPTFRTERLAALQAIADVRVGPTEAELTENDVFVEDAGPAAAPKVDYNWETEWYPLYLHKEVPTDAPLGLTVFDRPLVLFYDGKGVLNCLEDRCPHRAAKLSEGQIADGRLECLYHGWQFEGDGSCAKIPQLPAGAKIPNVACSRSYAVQESQGVIWVWLADKASADLKKIPWFEHYAREGYQDLSTIHELPYDYSILLENLMDPAHVPISHDRTDLLAKRENAQALVFELTERTARGFAGKWGLSSDDQLLNTTRFEAPCVLRNDNDGTTKDGKKTHRSAVMLCRPAGQGRSMLIVRFGSMTFSNRLKIIPRWELRKWMDLVGHGMPYYVGHRTTSPAPESAVFESAPVGPVAATASSYPAKGSFGHLYARDRTNRYFRHVIHCKECRTAFGNFKKTQELALAGGAVSASVAILAGSGVWKSTFVAFALLLFGTSWACFKAQDLFTTNFIRKHRK